MGACAGIVRTKFLLKEMGYQQTLLVPSLVIFLFALLIYFFPLLNIALHSDVHWMFRLQILDPALTRFVPEGLKQFGGSPGGVWDGCGVYYKAFGRANCLDVITFRWLASIGGGSNDRWLFAYLMFNVAGSTLLYYVLRKLGVGLLLAAVLVLGVMLAPAEPWMTPRISEPKAALLFLLALAMPLTSLRYKHWYSAGFAAGAVLIKEPMVVSWLVVLAVSIGQQMDRTDVRLSLLDSYRPVVLPHLVAVVVVLLSYLSVALNFDNRNDYVFFINERIPVEQFVATYWTSLKPVWIKHGEWWLLIPFAVLWALVLFQRRIKQGLVPIYSKGHLLIILGVLLAIVGHGLMYYLTNRSVTDNRYLIPSHYYLLVLFALIVTPLLRDINRIQRRAVAALVLGILLYAFNEHHQIRPHQWMLYLLGATLISSGLISLAVLKRRSWDALLSMVVWLVLLPIVAVRVDSIYQMAGNARANQRSWQVFVDAVADLPKDANVHLQFTDPYMIETAWGLQSEMIFRDRADINLQLHVTDTSEYDSGNGLLKQANESFNAGKDIFTADSEVVYITADRTGNIGSVWPESKPLEDLISLFLESPVDYFIDRYVHGKSGYLHFTLEAR